MQTTRSISSESSTWQTGRLILTNPTGLLGSTLLLLMAGAALLASYLYPGDPQSMVAGPLEWPGNDPAEWLGTDVLGRSLGAGLCHGARISLAVGIAAALLSVGIGTLVGALGGFYGGRLDTALGRVTEVFQTMPTFLFVIVMVAIGKPSISTIVISIGLASWPVIARLVRAEFRRLKEADFVASARLQGYSDLRIIAQEILPNALAPVIVTASVLVASAILTESALAFLGMGDPNQVSWGSMIGEGREFLASEWYLCALPGGAIVLTVLGLNLLGDALNDALNPRLRDRP
ncbi:putative peptide transport system permease protein [Pseudomonas reidholzensis]|uniref:Putative peptide transport system permease protein n=1 Tax=Pseudomonas reidholzensis TaxID=1785162 RepID=A0A383RZA5_9PSED|nr:ABC transporter permease [Pseudomonas reidholzensis]SYX91781.1 putative peptide transport system permease protein [Pseudomonas reidholzensis]